MRHYISRICPGNFQCPGAGDGLSTTIKSQPGGRVPKYPDQYSRIRLIKRYGEHTPGGDYEAPNDKYIRAYALRAGLCRTVLFCVVQFETNSIIIQSSPRKNCQHGIPGCTRSTKTAWGILRLQGRSTRPNPQHGIGMGRSWHYIQHCIPDCSMDGSRAESMGAG